MPKRHYFITGAAGFVGTALASRLLDDADNVVMLTDAVRLPPLPGVKHPENARAVVADLTQPADVEAVLPDGGPRLTAAFVLHGVMSGASEADPERGMRVNIDAVRAVLLRLARVQRGVRVVFASSNAVYGPPLPTVVAEATTPTPAGVYGTCKYMMEVLVNDLHRRGALDAVSARFPTISVRPGAPAPAASAFLSAVIREPLNGRPCALPLADRRFRATLCSPRVCVDNLLRVAAWPADRLPAHQRAVNFPGIIASVQDLLDALVAVAGPDALALVHDEPNAAYEALLRSWAWNVDYAVPLSLGLEQDESVESLVREYVETLGRK